MDKVRIRDLAKDLGMDGSKEILAFLEKIGLKGKSASSNIEGDLIERVRVHFKKSAPPPPPPQTLVVTRADGTLERRSTKVVLRRGLPVPPAPEVPPEVAQETPLEEPAAAELPVAAAPAATPPATAPEAAPPAVVPVVSAEEAASAEAVPAAEEAPVKVVEAPSAKPEEERKEKDKDKKYKKTKPHEKKVQKGVLKKVMIQQIVEEPEVPPKAAEVPAAEAEAVVVRQFQPVRLLKKKGKFVREKEKKVPSTLPPKASKRVFKIEEVITVGDLAHKMGIKVADVIKKLLSLGVPATVNQLLDADTAKLIAQEYGYEVENVAPEVESLMDQEIDAEEDLQPRPPVVTIMGHVDHGKTTLLDAVRQSSVADTEAGGITQHIGAYEVEHGDRRLVILDTPGHEAFTSMRARGAQVTDIVVLVVAADDGVMPQTLEAIDHAKAAGVPIVVAVNKIDKPGAQPDRIRQQLSDHGLIPEEWGGRTLYANVSAKKRTGIESLLELVLLQADVLELRANPAKHGRGTVIESRLEKGRGPMATVLVQDGTLKVGDPVVTGTHYGRVRALINHKGKRLDSAGPGKPVEIQGLNGLPGAGQKFAVLKDERTARQIALHRLEKERERTVTRPKMSLEDLHKQIEAGDLKELKIVLKADVQGSMEALQFSLSKLSGEKVKVAVIHAGVGSITESDIMLASASTAVIIGFNVRPEPKASDLAEREKVDVRLYSVIYEVIEDVHKAMEGMLAPMFRELAQGSVEVRNIFHVSRIGSIAGSHVLSGKITRNSLIRLVREDKVIHEGRLASLKRFKDDVREVTEGYDCGIVIEGFDDVKVGDRIDAYVMEKVADTLT